MTDRTLAYFSDRGHVATQSLIHAGYGTNVLAIHTLVMEYALSSTDTGHYFWLISANGPLRSRYDDLLDLLMHGYDYATWIDYRTDYAYAH